MSYNSGLNQTTTNTWYADLTNGDQVLAHVGVNAVRSGSFLNNGLKGETFFSANLERVLVPEPSTLAIAVLGLLGLTAIGRRWSRR